MSKTPGKQVSGTQQAVEVIRLGMGDTPNRRSSQIADLKATHRCDCSNLFVSKKIGNPTLMWHGPLGVGGSADKLLDHHNSDGKPGNSSCRGNSIPHLPQAIGELGLKIGHGNIVQQDLRRMSQAVMDKADVCAPALVVDDGSELLLAGLSLPEPLEVAAEIAQVGEPLPQLAGAHVAIEVDHNGCLSGSARHGPGVGSIDILELNSIVKGHRPLVVDLAQRALEARFQSAEDGWSVVMVDVLDLPVESRQPL